MRHLVLTGILLTLGVLAVPKTIKIERKVVDFRLVRQVLHNNPKLSLNQMKLIAYHAQETGKRYVIDPRLILAILAQESRYSMKAVNQQTGDYSIAQINHRTIKMMGFDKKRLMTDLAYAIDCAGQVLYRFKTYYPNDKLWWGRYNSSRPELKKKYVTLVSKYL